MVSLTNKVSRSYKVGYIKVTGALKWACKLPCKTETYKSAKCVPCTASKSTHNAFVSDLLKWALKCMFYATGPWIPIVSEISDFSSGIPDSKAQNSGFHKEIFLGVRIPQAKISRISKCGHPYMERLGNVVRRLYYWACMSRLVQTCTWF